MRIDELFMDSDEQAAGGADAPLPPDKKHTATIVGAQVKNLSFKQSDKNPEGKSLVLTVAVAGCQTIEDIIPTHLRGAIEAVCRSARIPKTSEIADLVGKHVAIETTLRVAQTSGREYVSIKWLPGPDPLPIEVRTAPPRTPARKAAAEFKAANGDDDIPF